MAIVMTTCPETGRTVSTVHRMKEPEFEALKGPRGFRCTICNQIHMWERPDAWLHTDTDLRRAY